ncbi:hypothetical protein [Novibacillus thermophilus]|uniref:Uncharacterized protein n=1 Tax=Novibacillus thermophilus TaxID=1471761 RepID=A0A1U9KA80_9BACL|nr:hypothetical protein [Novibacillus thermophilus]AQS56940.1 hypothetical protein B0W44_15475 [Novibacillus thermophilus]
MFDPIIISIGPLFLPLPLIVAVCSLFFSVWLAEKLSPEHKHVRRTVSEWLPTAILIALLVYKFAPALFDLKEVWRNPAMLLYMSGTDTSVLLASFLTISWLTWKTVKSPSPWATADVIAVSALLTVFVYNVLIKDLGETTSVWWGWNSGEYRYHPLHVYRAVLLLPLLVWVFCKWKRLQSGRVFGLGALVTGIVYTLASFADYQTGRLVFGLATGQWIGVSLAIKGWIFSVIRDRKKSGTG